ncbi:MarR family winged helix-turn-helix transcriptional regulator [Loigolactobacillus bifermentans]|nr:MarR family transcriptional regulator [Loigolactobacillus bifermentans]QGG61307.1 MarR family transcriptional regulator [Loigolactobacillus bifermentans]
MKKNVATLNTLLRQITIAQQRALTATLKSHVGLTPQQTRTLSVIQAKPGIIQRELADIIQRRSASISNLLQILERDGYIQRLIPANSGRSKQIFLTEKGASAIRGFDTYFDAVEDLMVQNLSVDEQTTLITLLQKVVAAYPDQH